MSMLQNLEKIMKKRDDSTYFIGILCWIPSRCIIYYDKNLTTHC
jgi:hypothetical protein